MAKRRRLPPSTPADPRSIEELVIELLHYSRLAPHSAYAHRLYIRGRRYIPVLSTPVLADLFDRGLLTPAILVHRIAHMKSFDAHFPSSPGRPPRYSVRIDNPPRIAVHLFVTRIAARSFIDLVSPPSTPRRWLSSSRFEAGELTISSEELEDIVEEEETIELPHPYPALAAQAAGRRPEASDAPPVDTSSDQHRAPSARPSASLRPKTKRPAASTSLADLAHTLNLTPQAARRILRARGVDKPYAWTTPEDIERITSLLKG